MASFVLCIPCSYFAHRYFNNWPNTCQYEPGSPHLPIGIEAVISWAERERTVIMSSFILKWTKVVFSKHRMQPLTRKHTERCNKPGSDPWLQYTSLKPGQQYSGSAIKRSLHKGVGPSSGPTIYAQSRAQWCALTTLMPGVGAGQFLRSANSRERSCLKGHLMLTPGLDLPVRTQMATYTYKTKTRKKAKPPQIQNFIVR